MSGSEDTEIDPCDVPEPLHLRTGQQVAPAVLPPPAVPRIAPLAAPSPQTAAVFVPQGAIRVASETLIPEDGIFPDALPAPEARLPPISPVQPQIVAPREQPELPRAQVVVTPSLPQAQVDVTPSLPPVPSSNGPSDDDPLGLRASGLDAASDWFAGTGPIEVGSLSDEGLEGGRRRLPLWLVALGLGAVVAAGSLAAAGTALVVGGNLLLRGAEAEVRTDVDASALPPIAVPETAPAPRPAASRSRTREAPRTASPRQGAPLATIGAIGEAPEGTSAPEEVEEVEGVYDGAPTGADEAIEADPEAIPDGLSPDEPEALGEADAPEALGAPEGEPEALGTPEEEPEPEALDIEDVDAPDVIVADDIEVPVEIDAPADADAAPEPEQDDPPPARLTAPPPPAVLRPRPSEGEAPSEPASDG